jgi:hypothetical protein
MSIVTEPGKTSETFQLILENLKKMSATYNLPIPESTREMMESTVKDWRDFEARHKRKQLFRASLHKFSVLCLQIMDEINVAVPDDFREMCGYFATHT